MTEMYDLVWNRHINVARLNWYIGTQSTFLVFRCSTVHLVNDIERTSFTLVMYSSRFETSSGTIHSFWRGRGKIFCFLGLLLSDKKYNA